ncbi:MAG: hypothetical protein MUF15_13755 [Acidobacteria bacterium]|nr:hypothetical protein [Acidobacteriota bacterium]
MYKKKFFMVITFILTINTAFTALTKTNNDTANLKFQFKIPAVSEKQNFYVLPKDKLKVTDKGDILVLSRKHCTIYRFDSTGLYTGLFLKSGEGPQELTYPQLITPLENNYLLILNDDKFIFYELKEQISEIERLTVPYLNIGDIEEFNQKKLFVLTSYPLVQGLKGNEAGKLIHVYDIKNKKNIADYFETPGEIGNRNSNELRSEYGSGDIYYFDNLLFLVFNQPGDMYIFNSNGELIRKISTRFPFAKYNTADVKRVESGDGNISIRMNYARTCQMNIFAQDKRVFLITRINIGTDEEPIYHFYLSAIDYKEGKWIDHLKLEAPGVDISKTEFKSFNDKNLIFLDEDFIYSFSLD